jgi:hypothetical protein
MGECDTKGCMVVFKIFWYLEGRYRDILKGAELIKVDIFSDVKGMEKIDGTGKLLTIGLWKVRIHST